MTAKAILCAQCKAPLRGGVGSVTCEYCGAANLVGNAPPSKTMMRGVVHDVLNEDLNRNGMPDVLERRVTPRTNRNGAATGPGRSALIIVLALAIGTTVAGAAIAFLVVRNAPGDSTSTSESTTTEPSPTRGISPLPAIAPLPARETAELHSLAFDGSGHVFAALGNMLLRADTATLKIDWNQPIKTPGFYNNHHVLVLAERIAIANDGALAFYSIVDGTLTGSYKITKTGFPRFCGVDNTVVVSNLGGTTLRVDALTARKSDTKVSCKSPPDVLCQKGEVCSWRRRVFADHTCVLNLRSGDRDFAPCDTDNGTGDKELVALNLKGKVLWTSKLSGGSRPAYMTVLGDTVLVHNASLLEAFDRATGARRWQKTIAGDGFAVTPDLSKILVGNGQTLVALAPADGHEIATLGPWIPLVATPAAP
ncbi:MAG: PQQ-binding-like beta-propeller repeat protein [Kofleriaceae bacterium]|nr:PQQ-binding-like beta-propeller repeat protein [Kofleriaceae bacterium]